MANDYASLIQTNPIVKFSQSATGWGLSAWCNYLTLTDADATKKYAISVYANTAEEAIFLSNALKSYIEARPVVRNGAPDDISIGIKKPVFDTISQGYYCEMIMITGYLSILGTAKRECPLTPKAWLKPRYGLAPC